MKWLNYKFLDMKNFAPAGKTLGQFAEMFGVKEKHKELFPYDFCDKFEKLSTTVEFPPRQEFYNKMKGEIPSVEEYNKAKEKLNVLPGRLEFSS